MSRLGRAAARLALRLHSRAWRDRYQSEVLVLIEDLDSGLTDAVDVARSALGRHTTGGSPMRFAPAHRHPGAFALIAAVVVLPTLSVALLSLLGHELGVAAVARAVDPVLVWASTVPVVDAGLVAAPGIALVLALLPLVDVSLESDSVGPAVAVRLRARTGNVAVAVLSLAVGAVLVWHVLVESVRIGY